MTPENWLLKQHLPLSANSYCFRLWSHNQFLIKLSRPRKSKLGDYRYRPEDGTHLITINCNLNPYSFLVVYLHEVAHYLANLKYGPRIKPHGTYWQQEMKALMDPLMNVDVFPEDILMALRSYLKAPKAATCSHPPLTRVLRKYDSKTSDSPLEQIPDGGEFLFRSRLYQKIQLRRTRVTCQEKGTKRRWLISKLALVKPI